MRRARGGRRFLENTAGAAAVEFALVVPLLLALVFSTLEAGWIMVQSIMLDRSVDLVVRELRLGQVANPTQEKLRTLICDEATVLFDCAKSLSVEFIPIVSDADYPTDAARCINRGTKIAPVLRFNTGGREQTVFVRACYVVDPITPGMGLSTMLDLDESGALRIISKSAFINEPA